MEKDLVKQPGTLIAGNWEIRPETYSVLGSFGEIQIPSKLCRMLIFLLSRKGEIVARDDLFEAVWGANLVSDDALNRYISDLRKLLREYPNPDLKLQTIRRVGYRLILTTSEKAKKQDGKKGFGQPSNGWLIFGVLLTGFSLAMMVNSFGLSSPEHSLWKLRPLTSLVGKEIQPALSRDGQHVVFLKVGLDHEPDPKLYLQSLSDHQPAPLDFGAADSNVTLSPVDQNMAFWRSDGDTEMLMLRSGSKKIERVLYKTQSRTARSPLVWSPQGNDLVFSERDATSGVFCLRQVNVKTGIVKILTFPGPHLAGDFFPQYAPDGDSIAFVRGRNPGALLSNMIPVRGDIFSLDFESGKLHRHSRENLIITGFSWIRDSGNMMTLGWRDEKGYGLYQLGSHGRFRHLLDLPRFSAFLVGADSGSHLVFEIWDGHTNLALWELGSEGRELPLGPSTRWDWSPRFDPSGKRIAFLSNRIGKESLWVYSLVTQQSHALTGMEYSQLKDLRWSPDGRRLAFASKRQGHFQVMVVDDEGREIVQVTHTKADHLAPSFSADGTTLFFSSNRTGRWEIWSRSFKTEEEKQWTVGGGSSALEGPGENGTVLYFTHPDRPGIWQVRAIGQKPRLIVNDIAPMDRGNWDICRDGIWYGSRTDSGNLLLKRVLFGARESEVMGQLSCFYPSDLPSLSISPDGKRVVGMKIVGNNADLYVATQGEQ